MLLFILTQEILNMTVFKGRYTFASSCRYGISRAWMLRIILRVLRVASFSWCDAFLYIFIYIFVLHIFVVFRVITMLTFASSYAKSNVHTNDDGSFFMFDSFHWEWWRQEQQWRANLYLTFNVFVWRACLSWWCIIAMTACDTLECIILIYLKHNRFSSLLWIILIITWLAGVKSTQSENYPHSPQLLVGNYMVAYSLYYICIYIV